MAIDTTYRCGYCGRDVPGGVNCVLTTIQHDERERQECCCLTCAKAIAGAFKKIKTVRTCPECGSACIRSCCNQTYGRRGWRTLGMIDT